MKRINVMNREIKTMLVNGADYVCITDIARQKNPVEPKDVVKNWMRSKNTIEYLGLWEMLNNPDFKGVEFDPFLKEAGSHSFTMSPSRWIEETGAIGLISKNGVNGGTFAQYDIAVKQNLIPATLTKQQMSMVYANEADVLNVALFGFTAKEWRDAHTDLQGNVRDYATVNQLICLSNMESLNSVLIKEGLPQPERLQKLNQIAISQMTVLESIGENKLLK
ncbi:KilA-N domain-containing protein [uncultured Fibrobacter sp.]|uniref:KilA-N domain-containing protein n=1 Tax=uncultured Fibrobacter sp. TaxID=261512 RepID=UPI0025CE0AFF|nr:KilA-N domain-containing protein [uncultured Fibrobacter sp.]